MLLSPHRRLFELLVLGYFFFFFHFSKSESKICFFFILPRLAIWLFGLWDAGRESHCLLVTGFHSSPSAELKAYWVTPLPTHTDKNTPLTGWHMWDIHRRVSALCVQQKDTPWVNERQQKSVPFPLFYRLIPCQMWCGREGGINLHAKKKERRKEEILADGFPR